MGRVPDPDDWFAGTEDVAAAPGQQVAETSVEPAPEGSDGRPEESPVVGPWSTNTKLAVAGVLLLAALIIGLLVGGVFDSGGSPSTAPTTHPATTPAATTQTTPTTTAATTTAPPAVTVPSQQLAFGDRGAEVTQLQRALAAAGYSVGTIDGVYGQKTKEAVQQLQTDAGLKTDGIAGPDTLAALEKKLNP